MREGCPPAKRSVHLKTKCMHYSLQEIWWRKDQPRRELPGRSLVDSWSHVTGGRVLSLLATLGFGGKSLPEQNSKIQLIAKTCVKKCPSNSPPHQTTLSIYPYYYCVKDTPSLERSGAWDVSLSFKATVYIIIAHTKWTNRQSSISQKVGQILMLLFGKRRGRNVKIV